MESIIRSATYHYFIVIVIVVVNSALYAHGVTASLFFTCVSHIILGCYLATKSKRLADAKPAARGVRKKKRGWKWRKIKMEWETKLRKVYRAGTVGREMEEDGDISIFRFQRS